MKFILKLQSHYQNVVGQKGSLSIVNCVAMYALQLKQSCFLLVNTVKPTRTRCEICQGKFFTLASNSSSCEFLFKRMNYTRKNNAEQWLNVTRTYKKLKTWG